MFHRSEKAVRYDKELEDARLRGHFHLVPNLARKLQKHDHQKQCVAKTAVCEKMLNDLLGPLEKDQRDLALQKNGPHELVLPPTVRPEKMKDIAASMEEALTAPGTNEEKELGEVIRSQMWLALGQWDKVVDRTESHTSGVIAAEGYAYVLVLKAFAYRGLAFEGMEQYQAALHTYITASNFISASKTSPSYYSMQFWISRILYRLCLLSLRLRDSNESLEYFRRYRRTVDQNFKANFGSRERFSVYYWYWRTLSKVLRQRMETEKVISDNEEKKSSQSRVEFYELKDELLEVQSQYEGLLLDTAKFPRAGSINHKILDFVDGAMETWKVLGSDPSEAKGMVQMLYRAAAKSFQSQRVMRHLITACQAGGNFVEAERSFDAYLFIVDNEKKALAKSHQESRVLSDKDLATDLDSDEVILQTMAMGVRLLVKHRDKGKKALDMAVKMEQSAKSWNVQSPEVLASVYHAVGMANSLWSMQTIEAETRPDYQSAAVASYVSALSHAPAKIETFYQLALQYAIQRNLEKSLSSLSQALHLNKSHIPSIHLLTLVLTSVKDFEKALQICHTLKFDHLDNLTIEDSVALMEMQLSYLRIVEVVSGRELALEVQKGIFKLYNRLFGPVLPGAEYVKRSVDLDQRASMPDQALRRTKSNVHEKKKNMTHLAAKDSVESNLSLQIPAERPARQRSLLRRRPRSRSVGAQSVETPSRSSGEYSEKVSTPDQNGSYAPNRSPLSLSTVPKPASGESKSITTTQRLPNHASEMPSKLYTSPSEHRDYVAKVYRAKLWLACAKIYRRGRQWDGAQAAIQDALLCDVCHEEVFTELGNLHLDQGSHFEAMINFDRAILHLLDYPPAVIGLAKALLTFPGSRGPSCDRAEVLLNSVTKLAGWDNSEAWFWLGEVYERRAMLTKAAECWSYCEELEERAPIREWDCVKPAWL